MNKKFVFTLIIVIFALSMSIPFVSIFSASKNIPASKTSTQDQDDGSQGIEGVVRKMENGQFAKGTHILDISGITIAALQNGKGVKLDSYIGKNVKIYGDPEQLGEEGGVLLTVNKIEEVK